MWLGFWAVEGAEPSPKFQLQAVGDPLEVSVNATVSGAVPLVGLAPKEATGAGGAVAVIVAWAVFEPPALVAVSVTV